MTPRRLFTVLLALTFLLTGCEFPITTSPTPLPPTAPQKPSPTLQPLPSAEAGGMNPTAAPPTEVSSPVPVQIPDPAQYTWNPVVSGLKSPTDIVSADDSSGRLFISEQAGRIRIVQDGLLLDKPFIVINSRVGGNGSEQGLLGLAFHPKFNENGYLYINYTDNNGNTHVARFTASGNSADPTSEKQILFVRQPFANHNGGDLVFGPDGYLYIALGDGGSGGDPYGNAQSLNTLLGKILRIDVDNGDPYAIPADNPYAGSGEVYQEIWASGLRNPWRISFDRVTGDFWIGDVGQNTWEEVDFLSAGSEGGVNFGWNLVEANHSYKGNSKPEFIPPVAEYSHSTGCSITGGFVYRGPSLPEWQGVYLYGDYCSGIIWGLASPPKDEPTLLFQTGFRISTFGEDEAGELYVADYAGTIYRLEKHP